MNYPSNIKKTYKNSTIYANRGMDLEDDLNLSNEYYILNNQALIYKKPTPIGVADVSYNTHGKIINKAYFKEQSTLDYNGLYRGKYIEYEAKVTKNKTSFPLNNIHLHQINHIRKVLEHQGIVFLVIKINNLIYILKGEDFINYIDSNQRKSIKYEFIKNNGYLINYSYNPPLDYLKIIDKIYF